MELTQGLNKAARGLLEWSIKAQAEASGISLDTLRSFESGRTRRLSRENESAALRCFKDHGLTFLPENGGGAGVRYAAPLGAADD
ncbi:MAG TPA: transcriptional regulator [Sulfitobacter sp.]|nr:transcriptional regulator [Sulfitobacter sp.]